MLSSGLAPIQLEINGVSPQIPIQPVETPSFQTAGIIVESLERGGDFLTASKLRKCHQTPSVVWCPACRRSRTVWNRCDLRICPQCQPLLAFRRAEGHRWWMKQVSQPKHVVLTVRNSRSLTRPYVRWFQTSINRLRRTTYASSWRGGCWAMETTNEGRGWHLHAHLLVDADWIDAPELARTWAGVVGQDFSIVKVRDASQVDYAAEISKYVAKSSEVSRWPCWDVVAFVKAISRVRLFAAFGNMYGKRREFREWLGEAKAALKTCKCGCRATLYGTPDEFDHWLEMHARKPGEFQPLVTDADRELPLGISTHHDAVAR